MIYVFLIGALILSVYAQFKVKSNFTKYTKVPSSSQMTGAQVAKLMLDRRGIYDVTVQPVPGVLTDHYDPRSKTVRLSEEVYDETSISAVSVAAHEVGHALQHNEQYAFLSFRSALAPVANFASKFVYILIVLGFLLEMVQLIDLAIVAFSAAVLFQIVTLPVEFNASKRALANLQEDGVLAVTEIGSSKKVLGAAALTYVAAMAVSLLNLARLIIMRNSRD
ncbi:MAG: zinc metallopeptidase [Tissierellia bacterium]|nr:zinc metallopeptidase [Tissierellia bacterium]